MSRDLGFMPNEENYFFISYNSEDCERISPIVQQLHYMDVGLWYDDGLKFNNSPWDQQISEKIADSKGLLLFYTNGIIQKEESFVATEFSVAQDYDIPIYIVPLDKLQGRNSKCHKKNGVFYNQLKRQQHIYIEDCDQSDSFQLALQIIKKIEPEKIISKEPTLEELLERREIYIQAVNDAKDALASLEMEIDAKLDALYYSSSSNES